MHETACTSETLSPSLILAASWQKIQTTNVQVKERIVAFFSKLLSGRLTATWSALARSAFIYSTPDTGRHDHKALEI